jgi:ABC-type uncharacterized transport system substrate-binding protein
LELLRELVPNATVIAALTNPTNPNAEPQLRDLQAAAHALGLQFVNVGASNDQEIDGVFATLPQRQIAALVITAARLTYWRAGISGATADEYIDETPLRPRRIISLT